jgi:hypothetical protein
MEPMVICRCGHPDAGHIVRVDREGVTTAFQFGPCRSCACTQFRLAGEVFRPRKG